MSTNYYAHILPTKERKQQLHDAIEANDFSLVKKLTAQMYETIERDWETNDIVGGVVHLGLASGGWKFLWNPNVFIVRNGHSETVYENGYKHTKWVDEPDTAQYFYPLTKQGIKAFIDREDVVIFDEYDKLQDKEEFWEKALEWCPDGDDGASYEEKYKNRRFSHESDLTRLLEREGYKFTTPTCHDFYSDGLRFSSNTHFS